LGPQLRQLSSIHPAVALLISELEKKKHISPERPPVDWEAAIRQWREFGRGLDSLVAVLDQSKTSCEKFGLKLFSAFHFVLFKRCVSNPIDFAHKFDLNVIRKLSYAAQDQLADLAVTFLCANLLDQHRRSLSILALRCPITKYINRFLECSERREMEILSGLHKAALVSAEFVRLEGSPRKKSEKGLLSLELVDSEMETNRVVVVLDRLIILRLRWRVLRDDSLDKIVWTPEFLWLCDSDPILFLRWELGQSAVSETPAILARLGIVTNFQILPKLLCEFLVTKSKPSSAIMGVLIQLLSRTPPAQIKLPERTNMNLLFQLECLWCTSVLNDYKVIEFLHDPPLFAAQQLLSCLPRNADCEHIHDLFTAFPHAFAAMLYHLLDLYGEKPQRLVDAGQIFERKLCETTDCPRFIKMAVAFVASKTNRNLVDFAVWLKEREWVECFLFFAICTKQYEQAVQIINSDLRLINFFEQHVPEEMVFVGAGKWTDSLIRFAVYCLHQTVSFAQAREWKRFLTRVKYADWPDGLALNQVNLMLLERALV
jgi:hypothetical protein